MTSASRPRSIVSRPAWRRYMIRFSLAMGAYIGTLLPVDYLAHRGMMPAKPWLYLVAVAPAIPVAAVVVIVLRYLLEEDDEYQRMLSIRAYIAATGLLLTVCTGWGFLQDFGGLPQISLHHVFVLFCVCQGLTTAWIKVRSR
jgi:hypothetical protein